MTRARDVANIDVILTAKGDIYAASSAYSPVRVGVGANGTVLLADSAQTAGVIWSAGIPVQVNAQTATYTAILSDAYKLITMSVGSANDFNIPTNSVAYPVGTVMNVIQIGTGQTTIKALTPGTTTVLSTGATAASPKLRAQYSAATCIKVATETWYVLGDIA